MRPRSDQEPRSTSGRRRLGAALSVAALAASTLGAVPAHATVGPNSIKPGVNITVFHNIDFVATFGWGVGDDLTVEVFRNDVLIGSAAGETFDADVDGFAMEVNHGPAGAPAPGDCFDGHTPDIRPGDLVRVTEGHGAPISVSDMIVDDLGYSGPATEIRPTAPSRCAAGPGPPPVPPSRSAPSTPRSSATASCVACPPRWSRTLLRAPRSAGS